MGSASQEASTSSDVSQRIKFKRLDKTARHIMQILDKEAVEEVKEKREIPDIRPGYIVQLKLVLNAFAGKIVLLFLYFSAAMTCSNLICNVILRLLIHEFSSNVAIKGTTGEQETCCFSHKRHCYRLIARRNAGLNTTFRIRRLVAGVGVESLFPLFSVSVKDYLEEKEIKVVDKKKVRRAKLYHLRDKMNALKEAITSCVDIEKVCLSANGNGAMNMI
ncbi:Ribosomal protein L19 family protein [Forsythia ovata]|uniref:Ribosomal protein L19 family protein n=1 Tax=Forsythia ovata TaxID=205694 RepID=A0ABD1U500_9LAMI